MTTPAAERNFHFVMALLLVTTLVAERPLRELLPGFDPPTVTLLPFAIGLTWVVGTMQRRLREVLLRLKVLEEQQANDQRRLDELTAASVKGGRGNDRGLGQL